MQDILNYTFNKVIIFYKMGTPQYERDRMKDRIFQKYQIYFRRYPTNGSGEIEDIGRVLDRYENSGKIK